MKTNHMQYTIDTRRLDIMLKLSERSNKSLIKLFVMRLAKDELDPKIIDFWIKIMSLLRWGYILGLRTFLALGYFHSNFLAFP